MVDGMMGMGWWMLLWVLVVLAVLVLLAVGIGWLVRALTDRTRSAPAEDAAELELRRRYAAGEIDCDEYFKRRDDLTQGRSTRG
ncbi:putative membrane protein [Prauserella muralis]|nr:putative membrane protein [Prauserella muralis]